jgi:hypothetical protein
MTKISNFSDNFIHLNILFHELSYEEVSQQKAYDILALLGMFRNLCHVILEMYCKCKYKITNTQNDTRKRK